VHDADHTGGLGLAKQRPGVVFRLSRVNDDWPVGFGGESYLGGKRQALGCARRIVVVIVEPALADGDRGVKKRTKPRDVALLVERGRVVWVDSGGGEDEARMSSSDVSSELRYRERLTNADDGRRARFAGAGDYRVAVAGEGRVREVGVAVDEDGRTLVLRGHLRSIQRSTGAAT
jgi:hypothetical protein